MLYAIPCERKRMAIREYTWANLRMERNMGKIEGIKIQNYGVLKDIVLGKTRTNQRARALGNLVAVIGQSGNGKSSLADAFGFIADCLEVGVEAACDANNRGGFERLITQGAAEPILFELYYRESSKTRPITYELEIDLDKNWPPLCQKGETSPAGRKAWMAENFYVSAGGGGICV